MKIKMKTCLDCGKPYKNTIVFFNTDLSTIDDLSKVCRLCSRYEIKMKYCTKCQTRQPATTNFFNKDKNTLKDVCIICENRTEMSSVYWDYYHSEEGYYILSEGYACCKKCEEWFETTKGEAEKRLLDYVNDKNKDVCNKCQNKKNREYMKSRRETDINFKIMCQLRTNLRSALKNNKKTDRTLKLTACSIDQLKEQFSRQCYPHPKTGVMMTLNDLGKKVHIDHIRPVSSFDLSDPEQQKICFHWSNLQVLWKFDNLSKNDKPYQQWLIEKLNS